jgi:hypothetical protein
MELYLTEYKDNIHFREFIKFLYYMDSKYFIDLLTYLILLEYDYKSLEKSDRNPNIYDFCLKKLLQNPILKKETNLFKLSVGL